VTRPQQSCPASNLSLVSPSMSNCLQTILPVPFAIGTHGVGDSKMNNDKVIQLDPCKLLGLSQVARVSDNAADSEALGRVLSKIGENGSTPVENSSPIAKLLSKIGEGA